MPTKRVIVDLEEEAYVIALGQYLEGLSLRPGTRARIEETPVDNALGTPIRHVPRTPEEVLDAYDYFRHGADALVTVSNPRSIAYARARDNVRRA